MRAVINLMCAVALCSHTTASPQPVPDKATKLLNDPLTQTECVSELPGAAAGQYPFSVDAIRRALTVAAGLTRAAEVHVLVVDNNFYGYKMNETGDGRPPRLSSRNFPKDFFYSNGNRPDDFAPWLREEDITVATPPSELIARHGTHVAGIVLGGMYAADSPPMDNSNLERPSARSLLLEPESVRKTWLRISFLNVHYGSDRPTEDPVNLLRALGEEQLAKPQIINMSLGKALSGSEPIARLPDEARTRSLVVTSAGNSGRELRLDGRGLKAVPAILDNDGRMLVVASHDADGQLSRFSNYGLRVNIAAPGCRIRSWTDGDQEAVALSGTSMATAVVTFGAALVYSRWQPPEGGRAIHNRILASARYNPDLRICEALEDEDPNAPPTPHCVEDGAMLDIETALLVNRDYVAYEECGTTLDQPCVSKVALGTLEGVPRAISRCAGQITQAHAGLSLNGAVKYVDRTTFLVAYEPGLKVGSQPIETEFCTVSAEALSEEIVFVISGPQLNGPDVSQPRPEKIPLSKLRRLVIRGYKS